MADVLEKSRTSGQAHEFVPMVREDHTFKNSRQARLNEILFGQASGN
ncbi:hypothetical protein GIHI108528_10475 [Gillisia hiemivivida]|jgi:hypothetical protein